MTVEGDVQLRQGLTRDELVELMAEYQHLVAENMETAAQDLILKLDMTDLRLLCRRLAGNANLMAGMASSAIKKWKAAESNRQ